MSRYRTGINHIELWVSDLSRSALFYKGVLELIGWQQTNYRSFATDSMEIYLVEHPELKRTDNLGVRHIGFQALAREQVEAVACFLQQTGASIIRGPVEMPYSKGYYTIDFYDPDGMVVEVAHTPNMDFKA
ncbi:VOC family protein [Cesiribacter sp. SM1]|uniref:VOC family protein n=1 Tax=Cesiribacter sp. SM1 TaxID=2861196 RepID=UPI001CD6D4AC|nr:VOC family protein [Cesiribacter sp. SM1]